MASTFDKSVWSPKIIAGKWRWMSEIAHYSDSSRKMVAQTADIRVNDGKLFVNQRFDLADNTSGGWTWEGPLGGPISPMTWDHDGSYFIDITFYELGEWRMGDSYAAKDGSKAGSEYYQLQPDRFDVWGCYTLEDGKQFPYYEAWERLEDPE